MKKERYDVTIVLIVMISYWLLERINDTKRVIRRRKLKDKQYNGQRKGTHETTQKAN
jgi:hypothetical protein